MESLKTLAETSKLEIRHGFVGEMPQETGYARKVALGLKSSTGFKRITSSEMGSSPGEKIFSEYSSER
jgi:hypothetical protein